MDDGAPDLVTVYELRRDGHPTERRVFEAGGRLSELSQWEYDIKGRTSIYTGDRNNDGLTDRVIEYLYDDLGHLVLRRADEEADEEWDWAQHYSYRSDGALLYSALESIESNRLSQIYFYHLDGAGNVTRIDYDSDGDGTLTSVSHLLWRDGLQVEMRWDGGADGVIDALERIVYDDKRREIRREADLDLDGVPESVIVTAYFDDDRVKRWDVYRDDMWSKGERFEYDSVGRMIEREIMYPSRPSNTYRTRYHDCPGVPELVQPNE